MHVLGRRRVPVCVPRVCRPKPRLVLLPLCLSCLSRALAGYPVFWHSERKLACRDGVDLVSRWVLRGRERGVSNTLLVDQRVCGRRDRIGLDSAVDSSLLRWPVQRSPPRHPQLSIRHWAVRSRPARPRGHRPRRAGHEVSRAVHLTQGRQDSPGASSDPPPSSWFFSATLASAILWWMRKFACSCATKGADGEQWHTLGARVRDCRHEGKCFAAGFERLAKTRLSMPDTPDESPGCEEQVSGNVQGYVRVLHWAVAGGLGVAAGVRWRSGLSAGPI